MPFHHFATAMNSKLCTLDLRSMMLVHTTVHHELPSLTFIVQLLCDATLGTECSHQHSLSVAIIELHLAMIFEQNSFQSHRASQHLEVVFKNVRGRGTLFSFHIFFSSSLEDSNSKKDDKGLTRFKPHSHLRQSELFTHSSSSEVFRIHTTWVCRTKACHSC